MPNPKTVAIEELERLEREATKAPWKVVAAQQAQYRCVSFSGKADESYGTSPLIPADARLIVALRNAAPAILAALRSRPSEKSVEECRAVWRRAWDACDGNSDQSIEAGMLAVRAFLLDEEAGRG